MIDIPAFLHGAFLGEWTRQTSWLFGAFETIHFIGASLLIGAMTVVDLRLLGFLQRIPIGSALTFLYLAILGFALNLVSGLGFITSNPYFYWDNPAFWWKMSVLILAGLNAVYFTVAEHRHVLALPDGRATTAGIKLSAFLSLALWFVVLLLGRLLPAFEGFGGESVNGPAFF